MTPALRFAVAAASLSMLVGCGDVFGTKDAHHPGTDLGSFQVTATLTSSTCGEGALGAGSTWEFEVQLARGDSALFWNNGAEVITGALDEDRQSFSFQSAVEVDMRTEEDLGKPPCAVRRDDNASGVLDSADDPVHGFTGTLGYAFSPTEDSECSDLLPPSEAPVFAALPCSMAYAVEGEHTE